MNLFESILGNKIMRDFAFGKVKEIIIKENLECIKIYVDTNNELQAELIKKQNQTENNGNESTNG